MVECSLSQHSMCDEGCHRGGRLRAVKRAETHCKLRALGKTRLSDHQPDELVSKPLFLFFFVCFSFSYFEKWTSFLKNSF